MGLCVHKHVTDIENFFFLLKVELRINYNIFSVNQSNCVTKNDILTMKHFVQHLIQQKHTSIESKDSTYRHYSNRTVDPI